MFIVSAKLTKRKLIAAVIVAGLLLCALILLISTRAAAETAAIPTKGISTNDDRLAFITSYGLDVKTEPLESMEVLIPKEFDTTFTRYNELQITQGFDLNRYKGKRVMRYTYEVVNYPNQNEGVRCTLLIYKNQVIGGDVCSVLMDGFMHGLSEVPGREPEAQD